MTDPSHGDAARARTEVARVIRENLDRKAYKVVDTSRPVDVPEAGTCLILVVRQSLRNHPGRRYRHAFEIWVIEPKRIDPDDDLDDALDDTVTALEKVPGLLWEEATRGTYGEQPAYRITATAGTTRTKD
jgi:hypothetical protein